jgi:hypothetical protein
LQMVSIHNLHHQATSACCWLPLPVPELPIIGSDTQ